MTARGIFSRFDALLGTPQPSDRPRNPPDDSLVILREETQVLNSRLPDMNMYRDYYEGIQSLVFGTPKFKTEVGLNFEGFKDNWAKVVVNAMLDRLHVDGFTINEDLDEERVEEMAVEGGVEELTRKIWTILARNNFDHLQGELHTGVLVESRASVIVWPDPIRGARVDWNPGQNVTVRYDDERDVVLWAVKRWKTPGGAVRVNLYFPNRLERYLDTAAMSPLAQSNGDSEVREMIPEFSTSSGYALLDTIENPLNEVPVVEFRNRGGSEIRDVIAQQDALNYLMIAALNASGHAGFPQRVMLTNAKEPVGGWKSEPGAVWQLPHTYDPDGNPIESKIDSFSPPDLDKFANIIQEFLRHVASTSSTPMRFFYHSDRGGRGDAPSGESLRVDDEPLIDKVEALQPPIGNRWYEVFRLIAKAARFTSINPFPVGEPYWTSPEARHRSLLLEDAAKMKALGIPFDYYIEQLGLSPLDIQKIKDMREEAGWTEAPGEIEEAPPGLPEPPEEGGGGTPPPTPAP